MFALEVGLRPLKSSQFTREEEEEGQPETIRASNMKVSPVLTCFIFIHCEYAYI